MFCNTLSSACCFDADQGLEELRSAISQCVRFPSDACGCGCIWRRCGTWPVSRLFLRFSSLTLLVDLLSARCSLSISSWVTSLRFFFLNSRSSSSFRVMNFGSCVVEVASQGFAGSAQRVFQLVGQHQFFFPDFGELEDHIFQATLSRLLVSAAFSSALSG